MKKLTYILLTLASFYFGWSILQAGSPERVAPYYFGGAFLLFGVIFFFLLVKLYKR